MYRLDCGYAAVARFLRSVRLGDAARIRWVFSVGARIRVVTVTVYGPEVRLFCQNSCVFLATIPVDLQTLLTPFAQVQQGVADQLTGAPSDLVYANASCSGGDPMALCMGAIFAFPATWGALRARMPLPPGRS